MKIIEAIQNLLSKLDGKPEYTKIYNDLSDLQDELASNLKEYFYFNIDSKPEDGVMLYSGISDDLTDVASEIEDKFGLTDVSVFDDRAEATSELVRLNA